MTGVWQDLGAGAFGLDGPESPGCYGSEGTVSMQAGSPVRPFEPPRGGVVTGPRPVLRVSYEGSGGTLFVLVFKNLLLTLVTLGIYLPWARTERRKYLWQNIDVGGHRLRYHGTGIELLKGYAKVLAGYVVFFGVPLAIQQVDKNIGLVVQGVFVLALLAVLPLVIWGSQRYRLSRTSLRNVRFGLDPESGAFFREFMKCGALVLLTFGIYGPIFRNRVHGFMMRRTRYGTEPFGYDGPNGEAFKITAFGMLLNAVTLGIYFPWYIARLARFRVEHTTFMGARGRLELTGGDVFLILLASTFGIVLTFGIAFPWITTYVMRTFASKISFVGDIDFTRVARHASGYPFTGFA